MTERGAGDRWLAGESVPGVEFAHHAHVRVVEGAHAGRDGRIALLMSLGPDPVYVVMLAPDAQAVKVRQGALRAATGADA